MKAEPSSTSEGVDGKFLPRGPNIPGISSRASHVQRANPGALAPPNLGRVSLLVSALGRHSFDPLPRPGGPPCRGQIAKLIDMSELLCEGSVSALTRTANSPWSIEK